MQNRIVLGMTRLVFYLPLALGSWFVIETAVAGQGFSLVYSSGHMDTDKLVHQRLSEVAKSSASDFNVQQGAALNALNELKLISATAGATFGINILNYLAQQPQWPHQAKTKLTHHCLREVFASVTNIPVESELAALKYIEGDEHFAVPPSPLSEDGGDQRKLYADWWMHAWTRYASEINSPDLITPGPSIDLPQFSAASLSEPRDPASVAKRRLERQELIRQRDQLHLRSLEFAEVKSEAERILVAAYTKPPFAFDELSQILSRTFGDRHPTTSKILRKLADELPPEKRIDMDRLIAKHLPAASLEEIRIARKMAKDRGSASAGSEAPVAVHQVPRKSSFLADLHAASPPQASVPGVNRAADGGHAERGSSRLWYALASLAGALMIATLWRAQARAHPGRPK